MALLSRLLGAVALGLPVVAYAGPSDYVHAPAVEYGEREIDFKAGTWNLKDEPVRESAASLGFGYGATQWWFTEFYIKYGSATGVGTHYDAFEWENLFQLTEHNQYFADFGVFTEFEVPKERAHEGYEFVVGALVQGDAGPIRWNANLLLTHIYRGEGGVDHATQMGYQVQGRYGLGGGSEVGVQAFGDMGKWNHWDPASEQRHRVGPAYFGKVKLGAGREAIRYNAAVLFGASHAAPKTNLRVQAEYEF